MIMFVNRNKKIRCNECKTEISKTDLIHCNGKCQKCYYKAINL